MDVHGDVYPCLPELCRSGPVEGSVGLGDEHRTQRYLPETGQVVESGEYDDEDYVEFGSAVRAEGASLEGMTDRHEALQGHRESQVY